MKNTSKKSLIKAQKGKIVTYQMRTPETDSSRTNYSKSNMFRSKPISKKEYDKKYLKYASKPNSSFSENSMTLYDTDGSRRVDSKTISPRKNSRRSVTASTSTPIKKKGGVIKNKKK